MRSALVVAALLPACAGPPAEQAPADAAAHVAEPPPPSYQGHVTAFVDIAVATMESAAIAPHQTVLIDGKSITAFGPAAAIEVPAGATVIDGRGKFLIPGLHDMHVHLDHTHGMLELFVAAGVTTVRNMAGSPRTVALKKLTASGAVLGPTIYTTGPFVDGARPRWEASASVVTADDAERV
ncbi:MAG TPA: hypothetical protein VH143_17185, partial [Kofleriaceae bacterium]|nr:hypothetical protein [Kofleriaceae bacterium]